MTGGIGYCDLAKKYGVSASAVKRRGKKGNWVEKKEAHAHQVRQAVLAMDAQVQVDRFARLVSVADVLLTRVEELGSGGDVSPASLKTLTEALKNIRDAQTAKDTAKESPEGRSITVVLDDVGEFVS